MNNVFSGEHDAGYKIVEEEQKRSKEKNEMQDVHLEEVKALIQEIASQQQIMQSDVEILKQATMGLEGKIDRTDQEVKDLRSRLENGWKKDLIDKLVAAQTGIKISTEERKTKILSELIKIVGTAVGTGGVLYLLVQNLIRSKMGLQKYKN